MRWRVPEPARERERWAPTASRRCLGLCHYGSGGTILRTPGVRRAPGRPALDRRLGQHHLRSGTLALPLVDFLRPSVGDRVLEIGPGGGALTAELLATGARVLAVELDPAWALALRERVAPGLALAVADALEIAWERLPAPTLVAGNLPYGVGTAILERFLIGAAAAVPRAAFLLQREVVDRIVARPGEAPYGALSVLVASRAEALRLGRLPPGAFRPPPAVESAFVGLRLGSPFPGTEDLVGFLATLRAAFTQRRKTLRNSLASAWGRERAERLLAVAGLDPAGRAERLGLEAFARLHRAAERDPGC